MEEKAESGRQKKIKKEGGFMPVYQFLFHNTRGAIRFEDTIKTEKVTYKIMPPPVQIQNCCGISIRVEYDGDIEKLICPDVREIYLFDNDKYELFYSEKKTYN